jgi:hypothetical protein
MELFRAEYKYMDNRDKLTAIRMETKTGIDKEIYGAYMSGFQHSLYYREIYAPLFSINDSVLIFDHHNDLLFIHDRQGHAIDSLAISYHQARRKKFSQKLIRDRGSDKFYGLFHKNGRGFLRPINLLTGEGGNFIEMYYRYPENMKVRDNRVYYVYRKTGSAKTRHLFVEKLDMPPP